MRKQGTEPRCGGEERRRQDSAKAQRQGPVGRYVRGQCDSVKGKQGAVQSWAREPGSLSTFQKDPSGCWGVNCSQGHWQI